MTRLHLSPLPRYHHRTSTGGAYGQQLNQKDVTLPVTSPIQVRSMLVGYQPTGDTSGLVSSEAGRLIFAMSQIITTIEGGRKFTFSELLKRGIKHYNFIRTKVRISRLRTRKNGYIMMLLVNSTYEKSAQQLAPVEALITLRPKQEVRMSLFLRSIACNPHTCDEQTLNLGGVSS